ncbi:hypothetical protein HELRODRAFT_189842, partial [Helobdella robusta]|uniref:Uncharacterized protein n=1 Tax=Helobdella robusta TaxID=6412 RepID=T1FRF0_HELRO
MTTFLISGVNSARSLVKKHYKPYYDKIVSSPIHEQNKLYCDYSRIIESNEGRKKIQFAVRPLQISQCTDPGAKFLLLDDPKLSNVSNIGSILNRLMLQYGYKNLGEMFSKMSDELITTEEEATKAFEVANILTKTLLEYRLKTA